MISVTRPYLPPIEEYLKYIEAIWQSHWVTNNGPLVRELEENLRSYLGLRFLQFTTNGTIALQVALRSLGIRKEVITTPFSYVATTSTILWEGCVPVFVDIDPNTFCIDPNLIEQAITSETEAILATHVYGFPCDVVALEDIGKRYGVKIIYDAAHAFGAQYLGRSLLDFGDVSACSFHATKLFHTGEGGCVVSHGAEIDRDLSLRKSFGHIGDQHLALGINGKNSELHAAMGLAVLPHIADLIAERKALCQIYDSELNGKELGRPIRSHDHISNYAYYPVVFSSEGVLETVLSALAAVDVVPRRYFWPSLNTLPYLKNSECAVSEDLSRRVLCLPLYNSLEPDSVKMITREIRRAMS